MIRETKLKEVIGQPMSAVSFVQDYIEFHFDGKVFRALSAPTVCVRGAVIVFPETGSRDALCMLIGKKVADIIVQEDKLIEIYFHESGVIRVPLSKDSRLGPEAAHFVPGENEPIEVW